MKIIYPFWLAENLAKKRFPKNNLPVSRNKYIILKNKKINKIRIENEKN
jgi:hypothetical protein